MQQWRMLKFRKEQGYKCHGLLGTACLRENAITTCCTEREIHKSLCTWVLQTHKAVMLSTVVLGIKGQGLVPPHQNIWPYESRAQLWFSSFTFLQFFMVLNISSFQWKQYTECPALFNNKSKRCCCRSWSSRINQSRISFIILVSNTQLLVIFQYL